MAFSLATVFGFLVVSLAALFVFLLVGRLFRPSKPDTRKASIYECGEKPFGPAWFNFNNRFYIIALVFVIFDVEVALVVPAAVIFRQLVDNGLGLLAFLEVFIFLGILFIALIYVWRHGDLNWIREIKDPGANNPKEEPNQ
jgi:NADH-quinone oxidoreductase subunit A